MSGLDLLDWAFITVCLEGFLYGIYSYIFVIYLQCEASKRSVDNRRTTIVFCSLCVLYILSVVQFALDTTHILTVNIIPYAGYATYVIANTISGCCDFIGQTILIYRCWIVWNRNIRVVIIPSILAFIFLGLWVAASGVTDGPTIGQRFGDYWGDAALLQTSLVISLTVNAIVTGLIVLKIFMVYSEVKPFYGQVFGPTSGSKLRPIIFILIESGMALFCIQLARLVTNIISTDADSGAIFIILAIHQMFNGIIPTIIQVRLSMGLSFHDEPSLVEVASGLHFGSNPGNPILIPETGRNHQENGPGDDDNLFGSGIQRDVDEHLSSP